MTTVRIKDGGMVGKRIELVMMSDDPDPVPPGTKGTITYFSTVTALGPPYDQIGVAWDNGRTLGLASPPDVYRVLPDAG